MERYAASNSKKINSHIFLLTSVGEKGSGIGSIFIRDIIAQNQDIKFTWHAEQPYLLGVGNNKNIIKRLVRSLSVRLPAVQNLRFRLFLKLRLKKRVLAIEKRILNSDSKIIWVTTSSPEIICIAGVLAEIGYDVRATIWDAPEYLLNNLGLSEKHCKLVFSYFNSLMAKSCVAAVVSDEMREVYTRLFPNLSMVNMCHGIASLEAVAGHRENDVSIRIVFAGSLYSKNEWNAFIEALKLAAWSINNRKVNLTFVGNFPISGAVRPKEMQQIDLVSQEDVMSIMAEMDIGYLPYWLDSAYEYVARTSFPGKMTAYSAAGLSIFHHGPRSSSVTRFLKKYPYGVACDSLDPVEILDKLQHLVGMIDENSHITARRDAMNDVLSDEAMIRSFRALVADPPPKRLPC